jgi:hypothetical protein
MNNTDPFFINFELAIIASARNNIEECAILIVPLIVTMMVAMFGIHIHYGFSSIKTIGIHPKPSLYEKDACIWSLAADIFLLLCPGRRQGR